MHANPHASRGLRCLDDITHIAHTSQPDWSRLCLALFAHEWTNALGFRTSSRSDLFFRSLEMIRLAAFQPSSECCARQNSSCIDVRSQLNSSLKTFAHRFGSGSNDIHGSNSLVDSTASSAASETGDGGGGQVISVESG